jgi:hypothetical protein
MGWSCQPLYHLLCLVSLAGLATCGPVAAIVRPAEPRSEESIHLVIDLGSSGTRFCLYAVRRGPGQASCSLSNTRPVCSRVRGGLARLTKGRKPMQVSELIDPHLQSAWMLLGDPARGGDPVLRRRVRAAVALGTGGFRDWTTGQPKDRPEWQALFEEVEEFLLRETGLTSIIARPITGEEEGRLAWLGLSQGDGRPDEFAAIEAGGATIQFAVGKSGTSAKDIKVASDPLGQDVVFERFVSNGAVQKAFLACYNPKHPQKQSGARCIDLLLQKVFKNSSVHRLAETSSGRRLFGLGLSFSDLFRSYPAAPPWLKKQDRAMHEKLTFDHIRQLTDKLCPMTDAEIAEYAPYALAIQRDPSGPTSSAGTGRACYYLAYRAALLASVGRVAASGELYPADDEQWPRGAAVSGEMFGDCK